MPIYIGDYLSATGRLTTEQHGAYFLLIMDYWKNGPPPDDDAVLAQIARMSADAWSKSSSILRAFFKQTDGVLVHTRIDREKLDAEGKKAKNSSKAKAAAASRWAKDAPSNATSNACTMPEPCPSPSPSHIEDKEPNGSVDKVDKLPLCNRQAVVDLYHEILPELPAVRVMNDSRGKCISTRWRWILTSKRADGSRRAETAEDALAWLRQFFELAKQNDFLMGRGRRSQDHAGWQCDIDFLMTDRGLKHVIEKTGGAA